MANLTEQEKLVRRLPEPAPHPDHYLLVFKKSGKEWRLRISLGPGEPYKKPFLDSPECLVAYVVPSDPHLRYRFDRTYKTHDQLHTFKLQLILEYRVSDPASLVQKLELDPLQRVVEETDSFLQQRIKSLDWSAVELERIDLERVLFLDHVADGYGTVSGFAKLHRFADQRGLGIQRIAVMRELPEDEIQVSATALRSTREQQTAVLEHGTRALQQSLDLEIEDRKNAFDRRNEVAGGITQNIVRAFDQATDNIRSLDDIQRAVPKMAAIQGAITGVAAGALPVITAAGVLPGMQAVPLLSSSSGGPLTVFLEEVAGALGSLACDPLERQEILSFGLHIIAEALRGKDARADVLNTYVDAVAGKFSHLLPVLNQDQVKLLRRLQDTETLKKELG